MDPPPRPGNRPKPYRSAPVDEAPKLARESSQCATSSSNDSSGAQTPTSAPPRPSNRPQRHMCGDSPEKESETLTKNPIEPAKVQPTRERPITIQPADPEDPKFTESSGLEAKLKSLDKPGAAEDPEAIKLFSETTRKLDEEGFGGPTSRSLHYPGLGPGPQLVEETSISPESVSSAVPKKTDDALTTSEPAHSDVTSNETSIATNDIVPPPRPTKRPEISRTEDNSPPREDSDVFDIAAEINSKTGEKDIIEQEFTEGLNTQSRAEIERAEIIETERNNANELGQFAPNDEVEEHEQHVRQVIADSKPINENLETETITEEPEEVDAIAEDSLVESSAPEQGVEPKRSIEKLGIKANMADSPVEKNQMDLSEQLDTEKGSIKEKATKEEVSKEDTDTSETKKQPTTTRSTGKDTKKEADLGEDLVASQKESTTTEPILPKSPQRRTSDIDPKDPTPLKPERKIMAPKPKSAMAQRFEAALLEQTSQKPKPVLKPKPRLSSGGSVGGPPASSAFGARFADLNAALSRPPPVQRSSVASTGSNGSADEEAERKKSADSVPGVAEQSVDENETADAQLKAMPRNPRARARGPGGNRRLPSTVQPTLGVFVSKAPVWEIAAEKPVRSLPKLDDDSTDKPGSGSNTQTDAKKHLKLTFGAAQPLAKSEANDENQLETKVTQAAKTLLLDEDPTTGGVHALPKVDSDQSIPFPVKQSTRDMTPDREESQRYNFFSDTDDKSEGLSDTDGLTMFAPPRRGSEQIGVTPDTSYTASRPLKVLETLDEHDSEREPRLMGVNTELDLKSAVRRAIDPSNAAAYGKNSDFSNEVEDEIRSSKPEIPTLSSLLDKDPDSTMDFDDDLAPPISRTRMSFEDLLAQTAPVTTSTTPTLGINLSRYLDQGPQSTGFDLEIEGEPEEYFSIPVKRAPGNSQAQT